MDKAKKSPVDEGLKQFRKLEAAERELVPQIVKLGLGLLVLLAAYIYATLVLTHHPGSIVFVAVAVVVGTYMALNIGANDVANTMGPAVGSKALTLFGALAIAAVGNLAGAVIAGGDVVSTVSKGIIDINAVPSTDSFVWAMLGALMAAAVWVNLATFIGAPVSTTHAIVGGVTGAGIAAAGLSAVNWPVMGAITASWVISPVMGGLISAFLLWYIKRLVLYREDKISAARKWVPVFVAIMTSAFAVYLIIKGLKHIWAPPGWVVVIAGAAAFLAGWAMVHPIVGKAAQTLENERHAVARLFTIPLIFATGLLAFAHGANDVANAVGPLAAIIGATSTGGIQAQVTVPLWVMVVGGVGIAAGLSLFGPKLIRTVGEKITKLNIARAYAVALAAAITVIIASALGLPVSSTHVAIGAVFGVGFLREILSRRYAGGFNENSRGRQLVLKGFEGNQNDAGKENGRAFKKLKNRKLVRRRYFFSIIAAWVVTVPLAALLGAMFYFMIRGMLLG